MNANLSLIVAAFAGGLYNILPHGIIEMDSEGITTGLLEEAIGSDKPKVIEDYPKDKRGPSCLILGWTAQQRPIHACVGYKGSKPLIITTYRPDLCSHKWNRGFCSRR